jgi:mannose-6-phosphate isomerase-like protein (cupin superfamily)
VRGQCLEHTEVLHADPLNPFHPGWPLTVPPGQVNRATVHATVSEFWHVLAGEGQIWRRDGTGEETTALLRGVSIDIPVGTAFQYRCTGVDPLQFLCITMPPWPGDREATFIEGPWEPNAPEG